MTDPPASTTGAFSEPTDGCARSQRKSRANRRTSDFPASGGALGDSLGAGSSKTRRGVR